MQLPEHGKHVMAHLSFKQLDDRHPLTAVSFQGYYFDRTDAIILACSRVAGICTGVLMALVLTCIVFPVSGTGEVRLG